jgi:hypothetical protein
VPSPDCRGLFRFSILAGLLASLTNIASAGPAPERAAMAAFLFELPAFIEWPDSAFASPADPFRLCIVGEDPFGTLLEGTREAQAVGKRAIAIQREKTVSPDDHCQLMYIAGDPGFVTQSLAAVSGRPILTVTDAQTGDKGIVNFVVAQNHVHLQIDQQAALRSHLNVSSKLLGIATPEQGSTP